MISLLEDRFGMEGTILGDFDDLFLSFDEVPLEKPDVPDGDNSILMHAPWANPGAIMPLEDNTLKNLIASPIIPPLTARKRTVIVPHPRDLQYRSGTYMKGSDVTALDRALWRAGIYKHIKGTPFRKAFGPGLRDQVKTFQHKHGLKADGVYGLNTHHALAKYYDQRAIWLVNQYKPAKPKPTKTDQIVAAAMIGYNYRSRIHYTQGSARMWLTRHHIKPLDIPKEISIWEDCSSWATYLYWEAELPDPNGFGYNGLGYTGTLSSHGQRVWTDGAPIGSLHFYGSSWPFSHVTIRVTTSGRCVSHGSESGPLIVDTWYRGDLRQTRNYFRG